MSPRSAGTLALLCALLVAPAAVDAAATATPAPATPKAATPARKAAATARRPAAPPASKAASGTKATASAEPDDASARARGGPRTLEDIHIEGEIPVPQVLFITTRDQRRFVGFQHRRYQRTSRKIGEDTAVPSRILVTGTTQMPERSHSDE